MPLDPFGDDFDSRTKKLLRAVECFLTGNNSVLEAVYIMTPNGIGLPALQFGEHASLYEKQAREMIEAVMKSLSKAVTVHVTILSEPVNSVRTGVEILNHYAKSIGADLIALNTHARRGMDRFFLGSFAETLLLNASLPVFIDSPLTHRTSDFENILFPTDFNDESTHALEQVLDFAKSVKGTVTLFHQLDPIGPILPLTGFIAHQAWELRKIERQTEMLGIKERAEKEGHSLKIEIGHKPNSVASAIVETAGKLNVSVIVLSTKPTSPLRALGSVPRQVIRKAPCPVLLFPTHFEKENP